MSAPNHWRVPAHAQLLWKRWPGEDEYVFYHGASGDTHRFSELAGLIMEQVLEGPIAKAELAQWLESQGDETPEATLDNLYSSLSRLDFLEAADAPG